MELNTYTIYSALRLLATRMGQLMNGRDLSSGIDVADMTIPGWLHAPEIGGLIYLMPPFFANIGKQFVKTPKLYFSNVVPLLADHYNIKIAIAHPAGDALSLSPGEMTSFNPILCDFPK